MIVQIIKGNAFAVYVFLVFVALDLVPLETCFLSGKKCNRTIVKISNESCRPSSYHYTILVLRRSIYKSENLYRKL